MRKLSALTPFLMGVVCVLLLLPSPAWGQVQTLSATFFVAHSDTHEDASVVPITVLGGRPVTFEVRVREAGTTPKGGWQVRLLLDACRFETPAAKDILFGDYLTPGSLISVGPEIEQTGNVIRIELGQIALANFTTAPSGLLAEITVTAKAHVACPDPGVAPPDQPSAAFDLAILGTPDGVKYDITAPAGRFVVLANGVRRVFLPLLTRH